MEKEILREEMLATAISLSEIGECGERIWTTLWKMAGSPDECYEDITLDLAEKEDWKIGQLVDYILSFTE